MSFPTFEITPSQVETCASLRFRLPRVRPRVALAVTKSAHPTRTATTAGLKNLIAPCARAGESRWHKAEFGSVELVKRKAQVAIVC